MHEVKISLYGKKQDVLGWKSLLDQEKIPYTYSGTKFRNPSNINILVGVSLPKRFKNSKSMSFIIEPSHDNYLNLTRGNKVRTVVDSIFDTDVGDISLATNTYLPIKTSNYIGTFKTHKIFNDDIFPVVSIKNNTFVFNFNLSCQLGAYGYTYRTVETYEKNLKLEQQISPVDRSKVLRFMRKVLIKSFDKVNLPYIHLWYYPNSYKTVFIFRQDVDYIDIKGVTTLSKVINKYDITGTYFLNIDGGEEYEEEGKHQTEELKEPTTPKRSKYISALIKNNNEIGNHGYLHKVFSDSKNNITNIKRASAFIKTLFKVKDVGYASPGGIYNIELTKSLDKLNYLYSTNCTLGSEGFPYYPFVCGRNSTTLEIPSYNVCDACFEDQASGIPVNTLRKIYISYINKQLVLNEPVVIMGHPHLSGKYAESLYGSVFKLVKKLKIPNYTMKEFSKAWKERLKHKVAYTIQSSNVSIQTNPKVKETVEVIYKGKRKLYVVDRGFLTINYKMLK